MKRATLAKSNATENQQQQDDADNTFWQKCLTEASLFAPKKQLPQAQPDLATAPTTSTLETGVLSQRPSEESFDEGQEIVLKEEASEPLQAPARATPTRPPPRFDPVYDAWMYKVWRDRGMLVEKKSRKSPRLKKRNGISNIIQGFDSLKTEPTTKVLVSPTKMTPRSKRMSLPAAPVSTQKEHPTFANILQKWRDKSDDKPCPHFLSPEQQRRETSTHSRVSVSSEAFEPPKEVKVEESEASKIKSKYIRLHTRRDNKVRAKPRPERVVDRSFKPREIKSRGDFRQAVQQVLNNVTSPKRTPQSRPKSAPRTRTPASDLIRQAHANVVKSPIQTKSPKRSPAANRPQSVPRTRTPVVDLIRQAKEKALSPKRSDRSKSSPRTPVTDLIRRAEVRSPSIRSSSPSKSITKSSMDRSKSAPRTRSPATDLIRKAKQSPFPKQWTSPTQGRRASLSSVKDSNRRSSLSSVKPPKPTKDERRESNSTPVLRVQDLFYLPDDRKTTPPTTVQDLLGVPMHVNVSDMNSVADSKLTDMQSMAGSELLSPSSPWTKNVAHRIESKLKPEKASPQARSRADRPWQRDKLAGRVRRLSMADTMNDDSGKCRCASKVFSDKDELIDFFLPLMGTGCTCGKTPPGLRNPEQPTALENILRPWQVQFLAGFGIYRGDQMVKAHHKSAAALCKALRQYRKKRGAPEFRTKSCAMALQIWSKTCKAFVRSIRKQLTAGTQQLQVPNTLYILSSFLEKISVEHDNRSTASSSVAWSTRHSLCPEYQN